MSLHRLGLVMVVASFGLAGLVRADEPVLLRYKLVKGDKLVYRTNMEMKQTQSMMGQKTENNMTQEAFISRFVEDVDDQGKAALKTKAERRKFKAEVAGLGKYEFDSTSTERDTGSV